ncbi:SMRP1 protein, partial [Alcedo cyanopectus]|nr:SMRP1 protein [Ceyx cyanopectus]
MFLFSKKYKTPVSTYTDSYRAPSSIKMKLQDLNLQPIFKENKFVTQGLTMPPVENTVSQSQSEKKKEMQLYKRNSISPASYQPWNYSLAMTGEMYNPVFVNEDKYVTWRTIPYNRWRPICTACPHHTPSASLHLVTTLTLPLYYSCNYICAMFVSIQVMGQLLFLTLTLNFSPLAENMVADTEYMLPPYTVGEKGTSPSYYSPSSGCYYCLQGMDPYTDGSSAARRHLHLLGRRAWMGAVACLQLTPNAGTQNQLFSSSSSQEFRPPMYDNCICSSRWDTSHFSNIGGVQRGSYIIHPEFASEASSSRGH